jgi:signal transduction histidine kinase
MGMSSRLTAARESAGRLAAELAGAGRVLRSPVAIDVGLALAVGMSTAVVLHPSPPFRWLWWLGALAAMAVLLVGHRRPVLTFAVGMLTALGHLALGAGPLPVDLVGPIGLCIVASVRPRRLSLALLLAGLLAAAGCELYAHAVNHTWPGLGQVSLFGGRPEISPSNRVAGHTPPIAPVASPRDPTLQPQVPTWGGFPVLALVLLAAWLGGRGGYQRRARLAGLERRAEELERERDTQAALAVAAERGRISRELHDVVAHALSVVVLQAQGGQAELTRRPERTSEALGAIVETGRAALGETRRLLGALGEDTPDWAPAPGMERLPRLVAQIRAAGTPVDLQVEGQPRPLPSTVDLASYRIAQEALTNVMKHAGTGTAATIVVRYEPTALHIEVTDRGQTRTPAFDDPVGTGHGLRGMRERVSVLGGTFEAGPRQGGGFVVRASLPLPAPQP